MQSSYSGSSKEDSVQKIMMGFPRLDNHLASHKSVQTWTRIGPLLVNEICSRSQMDFIEQLFITEPNKPLKLLSKNTNIAYNYVGQYFNGAMISNTEREKIPHGIGRQIWSTNRIIEGAFVKGQPHGYIRQIESNGDFIIGNFIQGRPEPYKTKQVHIEEIILEGTWSNGQLIRQNNKLVNQYNYI